MRQKNAYLALAILFLFFIGCQKKDKPVNDTVSEKVPSEILQRLKDKGFSTHNVVPYKEGYIVEGDIYITKKQLSSTNARSVTGSSNAYLSDRILIIDVNTQYRTIDSVSANSSTPRTITVSLDASASQRYIEGLDSALARYNNALINLNFIRVSNGADISIVFDNLANGLWGYALYPSSGNTGSQIFIDKTFIDASTSNNPSIGFLATLFSHEIGHSIGFRHTDYFNRSFSGCAYDPATNDEGQGAEGAVHIPGTPTAEDAGSWMLACLGTIDDRPFNGNDLIALRHLYPRPPKLSGPLFLCSSATYNIENLPAGSTVMWSINAAPGSGNQSLPTFSNQSVNSTTLTYSYAGTGSYTLTATINSNGNIVVLSMLIQCGTIDSGGTTINGPSTSSPGSFVGYDIPAVPGATGYTWILPQGWTIHSGQGTRILNVITGSKSGVVKVRVANQCGLGYPASLYVDIY